MNTTTSYRNPTWWNTEHESAWERTKQAFKRDWDQTKHDFGGQEPDTNQKIRNTVKQAVGKESIPARHQPTYDELEPAYRYGFGARSQYGEAYPEWDEELESRLRAEWGSLDPDRKSHWEADREAIRHGWEYEDTVDEDR